MRIVLSTTSGVPMYEQIKTQIVAAVHRGEIRSGELLPSLRQLAAELRVSVITVTRAYNDLVSRGIVANEHGRGFVVLAVDPTEARAALERRVDDAITELVAAAHDAQLPSDEVQRRFDIEWKQSATGA